MPVALNPYENIYVIRSASDLPDELDRYRIYHCLYDPGQGIGLYYSPDGLELVPVSAIYDYALEVSQGNVPGVSFVNKFGTNHDIGTAYEHVWEQEGFWVPMPVATLMEVASTDANDTAAGSGAQNLIIEGIGDDGLDLSDTVILDGQTPVLTNEIFAFVNRAYIGSAGSTGYNEGDLYIADDSTAWVAGVPQTAAAVQVDIHAEHGQTQQCIYTVPADKTAYVTGGYISADGTKVCTYRFFQTTRATVADVIGVKRVAFEATVTGGSFIKPFNPYVQVPSLSTITVDAKVSVGSAEVSAGLDIFLVDN